MTILSIIIFRFFKTEFVSEWSLDVLMRSNFHSLAGSDLGIAIVIIRYLG